MNSLLDQRILTENVRPSAHDGSLMSLNGCAYKTKQNGGGGVVKSTSQMESNPNVTTNAAAKNDTTNG